MRARSPRVVTYGPQSIAPSAASASAVRIGNQSRRRFRISSTSFLQFAGTPDHGAPLLGPVEHVPRPLSNGREPLTPSGLTAKMP